ncbi:MAG: tRNA threonylcarbamoyladenosine dehydratase [Bacteroidales bacterium]|jgi:tRNA A37 threonylcarbamoyladenosine dehydratase|nr:tRNA threonylcarbamoyladenosine dehydratase [Bacteroidales bacterium]
MNKSLFNRTNLLLGDSTMTKIATTRVIIFGVGGVGSWCAESLIRTGIRELTLVDSDRICVTNINRQVMATTKTVGEVKVEALKSRLLEINPTANIQAIQEIYSKENASLFCMDDYDYVIDAIDSLSNKIQLLYVSSRSKAVVYSSMGAALKMDATRVTVAEFWAVSGCPMAAWLRRKMRKENLMPAKKILCVYSPEVLENKGYNTACGSAKCLCPKSITGQGKPELLNHEWCSLKARINGTVAHTTAIFGFMLAGLVIEDICRACFPN